MEMQIPQLRQLFESRVGQISSVLAHNPPAELGKIDPMMRGLKGFMFALEGMLRKNELQHMPFTARVELFRRVDEAIGTLKAMPDSLDSAQALGVLRMMDSLHRLCLHENLMASGLDASKLGKLTVILERKFGDVLDTIDKVADSGQGHAGRIEQATQERLAEIEGAFKRETKVLASSALVAAESIRSQADTIQRKQADAMETVEALQGELRSKLQQCQAVLDEQLAATGSVAAEIRDEQKAVTTLLARGREQLDSMQATIEAMAETAEATDTARGDLQVKLSEGRDVIGSMRVLLETSAHTAAKNASNVTEAQEGLASIRQIADDAAELSEQVVQSQARSVASIRETAQSVTAARQAAASAETMFRDAREDLDTQCEAAGGVLSEIQTHGRTVDDAVEQTLRQQRTAAESLRQAEEDLTQFKVLSIRGREATERVEQLVQASDDLKSSVAETYGQTRERITQIEEEAERLQRQFAHSLSDHREAARDAVGALQADQATGADLLGRTRENIEKLAGEITRIGELCTATGDAEGEVCRKLDQASGVVAELKSILVDSGKVKSQIEGYLAASASVCTRMETLRRETAAAADDFRLQQDQALIAIRGEIEAAEVHRRESETALRAHLDGAGACKETVDALLVEAGHHRDAARTAGQAAGEARAVTAQATGEVQATLLEVRRAAADIAGLLATGAEKRSHIDTELAAAAEAAGQAGEIRRELGEYADRASQLVQEMVANGGQSKQLITDFRSDGQEVLAALTRQNTELAARGETLQEAMEDLFGSAADGGLYRQFDELAQQSAPQCGKWLRRMIVSGAGGGALLATISSILVFVSGWAAGAALVAGLVPLAFFMHLCASQYTAERRAESEHQYRAAVGRSLAAYRKLLSTMRAEGIADSAYVDRMLSALFGASAQSATRTSTNDVAERQ